MSAYYACTSGQCYPRRLAIRTVYEGKGQGKVEVFPSSETEFFARAVDAQFTFHRAPDGAVTQVVLHQGGQDRPAKRIKRTP